MLKYILIKFFNLISSKFTFSGDIINGYCVKLMVIKAVTDLEDSLFRQKSERTNN